MLALTPSGELHQYDVLTGVCIVSVKGLPPPPGRAVVSANGRYVATSVPLDNKIFLWEAQSGRRIAEVDHPSNLLSFAFSPDGRFLASARASNGLVRVWEVATGRLIAEASGHPRNGGAEACIYSPDGTLIATAAREGAVKLWDADGLRHRSTLAHSNSVLACAFSADSRLLATGCRDGSLAIWDARITDPYEQPEAHDGWVTACAFSPENEMLATGGNDAAVKLWIGQTGQLLSTLPGHQRHFVNDIAFSPCGSTLAAVAGEYDGGDFALWNLALDEPGTLQPCSQSVDPQAFAPDGKYLTFSMVSAVFVAPLTVSRDSLRRATRYRLPASLPPLLRERRITWKFRAWRSRPMESCCYRRVHGTQLSESGMSRQGPPFARYAGIHTTYGAANSLLMVGERFQGPLPWSANTAIS